MNITRIFIPNRGEIASRIERTCRRLGIATVRSSPAYLDAARMVEEALACGADAVHPGYGFLSENAGFAQACLDAGLTWIGPRPEAIRALGSKESGRAVAQQAGVPVVPSDGFPRLIKASAGGGGRGMRVVHSEEELSAAAEIASSEALRAFGDGSLVYERYIENARHVEVQILGDSHGNVRHLFERECSIQRRHQKIIEEAPSPAVGADLRERLCDAAVRIGRAVDYENAGTVEFLLAPGGEFYFIEVNTRIQVEHPVTEEITGLDLIELQIRVAEGASIAELRPRMNGHAVEVRLCAEDPWNGFLPVTGKLWMNGESPDVRVETGLGLANDIDGKYDSLLAKFIAHAESRDEAIAKLEKHLRRDLWFGMTTNRIYLLQLLGSPEFRSGAATTAFLPDPVEPPGLDEAASEVASYIAAREFPKHGLAGYRNNPWKQPTVRLRAESGKIVEAPYGTGGPPSGVFERFGQFIAGLHRFRRVDRHPRPLHAGGRETANSPMPGQVLRVLVEPGQTVKTGQPLLVLEAMKMEQTVKSQRDGSVKSILVRPGDVVAPGQSLVHITGASS